MSETMTVRLWRGREAGEFRTYEVPSRANQTVLDVVTEVQRRHAPELAYRFACRVGVCGSCAMTVNGVPRWTCRTHVSKVAADGTLTVEPLRNLPRIKDLVADLSPFFDKWRSAGGRFEGTTTRHDPLASVLPESRTRQNADRGIECINCAVCYSACDVVAWNRDYFGPAALLRAWTLVNDERHASRRDTLDRAMGPAGGGNCHVQANCVRHCPIGLAPAEGVAGVKRLSLARFFGLDGLGAAPAKHDERDAA